jgi:hypothetical protein
MKSPIYLIFIESTNIISKRLTIVRNIEDVIAIFLPKYSIKMTMMIKPTDVPTKNAYCMPVTTLIF